jgi:hypothetical protein
MIPFDTWIRQIVGYADLITASANLRRAWIDRDPSITSAMDFGELFEQIFGDLDSDAFDTKLIAYVPEDSEARAALSAFLEALRRTDKVLERRPDLRDPLALLNSAEWRLVKEAASRVLHSSNHLHTS